MDQTRWVEHHQREIDAIDWEDNPTTIDEVLPDSWTALIRPRLRAIASDLRASARLAHRTYV